MGELITTIPESGRVPSGETDMLPEPPAQPDRRLMVAMMVRSLNPQLLNSQIPADLDSTQQPTIQSKR